MALEIIWTPQADKGLATVIEYLEKEWTFREILQLEENINQVVNQIRFFPDLYPKSKKQPNLNKAIIDKNNYFVYQVNLEKSRIEIINFRGTKQKRKH
jgi:plasmid stabilization system protein ParE